MLGFMILSICIVALGLTPLLYLLCVSAGLVFWFAQTALLAQ